MEADMLKHHQNVLIWELTGLNPALFLAKGSLIVTNISKFAVELCKHQ